MSVVNVRFALLIFLIVFLSACGSTPKTRRPYVDGAPPRSVDLSKIPEAVPKYEPRARYGNKSPYTVLGVTYTLLPERAGYIEEGTASWYGTAFHGRPTSTLEPYDMYQFTAAHKTLPLPTYARVSNLENGRSVIVKINDRGPFVGTRIIDLSYVAALKLDMHMRGTARVRVEAITPGETPRPAPQSTTQSTPHSKAPQAPVTAPQSAPVLVQCGAFSSFPNANALALKLQGAGFADARAERGGDALVRVMVGPLPDRASAESLREALNAAGCTGAKLVQP
jgi:rare lipoprotein A